jgi:hypothetical protein
MTNEYFCQDVFRRLNKVQLSIYADDEFLLDNMMKGGYLFRAHFKALYEAVEYLISKFTKGQHGFKKSYDIISNLLRFYFPKPILFNVKGKNYVVTFKIIPYAKQN